MPHASLFPPPRRWYAGLLIAALSLPGQAIDLGQLGKAQEAISSAEQAVSASKEAISTGKEAVARTRKWLKQDGTAPATPGRSTAVTRDDAGTRRLIATLDDALSASAREGTTVVSLRDQGPYFVQRQGAFVAPASAQWLTMPRGDSTAVSIDLSADPAGATFDLSTGQVRSAGRGVKVFVLSVHTNLPRRTDRRALDAIEQHGMLGASSVRLEWPRQAQDILEPTGGQLLVWASDNGMRFPSGFGPDGKLFTADDPMVNLSRGYTVVTLDKRGFSFDRSREVALSFHPVLPTPDIDLSRLDYVDAFGAFIRLASERYPYSEARSIDWTRHQSDALAGVQTAAQGRDTLAFAKVFQDIGQRLRDGQFRVYLPDGGLLYPGTGLADLGLSSQSQRRGGATVPMPRVWLLDNGRAMVSDVAQGSAAAQAGLRAGAEIRDIAGEPLQRYLERHATRSQRTTDSSRVLDALALRTDLGDSVSIKVSQAGGEQTLQLHRGRLGPPAVATAMVDSGPGAFQLRSVSGKAYGYLALSSFAEVDAGLEQWERSLASAKRSGLPGLIVDLRGNRGDSQQLAAHFLASFFSHDHPLRARGDTQRLFDTVSRVWRSRGGLGLPPQLPLYTSDEVHYAGKLVLLTGRECGGACQLFSDWLQRAHRAQVVAAEPTDGGAIGHTLRVSLPDGVVVRMPVVAEIGQNGQSYVEGSGVKPDLRIAVDHEFVGKVMRGEDPVLDAAVLRLDQALSPR